MGYPWQIGDALLAVDLNAAIANAGMAGAENVLGHGADPTGIADSSAAINAAAAVVAPNGRHKNVYLPAGTYRVNHQINLSASQGLVGDTRGSSILYVDQAFSPTDTAVIFVTASSYDAGPVLRDFGITFAQPPDQGSRANFKTLAAGGTSGPGGTGIRYPWAIAAGSDSFRTQMIRLRIGGAWDGITTNGHNAVFYLEDIEMGALDCGVSLGEGASGVLDFAHMTNYHFWCFDLNAGTPLLDVFYDGGTIALRVGNQNGLNAHGLNCFVGRVVFTSQSSAGWFYITNLAMDNDQATLEVADAFFLQITNMYSTSGTSASRPRVTVNNGKVQITNYYAYTGSPFPFLRATGGLTIITSPVWISYVNTASAVEAIGGSVVRITGGSILPAAGSWTVPFLSQSGTGALQCNELDLTGQSGSTGVAISFATDMAANSLGDNVRLAPGWSVSVVPVPPYLGHYAMLRGAAVGAPDAAIEVNLVVQSAANIQREISFLTAVNPRWRVVVDAATESGANAGANFSIQRFSDAGAPIDSPLIVNRATGLITMGDGIVVGGSGSVSGPFSLVSLPGSPSYANDAAAATGGVGVGTVYRNGSALMVRVT